MISTTLYKLILTCIVFASAFTNIASAQETSDIRNGTMEASENGQTPDDWILGSSTGGTLSLDDDNPFAGEFSAAVDTLNPPAGASQLFTNLMQMVPAETWRGKTVRLRGAVRTVDLDNDTKVQLWFRVDRPTDDAGNRQLGAFDNMQNRPIRHDDWQTHDIVLKVDDDATQLAIGMFVIGKGRAWLDDVTLEEVPDDTPTTDMMSSSASQSSSNNNRAATGRPQLPPAVMKAFGEAEQAPRQPFFTHWLWLPMFAMLLFAISARPIKSDPSESQDGAKPNLGLLTKVAVRFSVSYWLLYNFPTLITAIIPKYGYVFGNWYKARVAEAVTWFAQNVLSIERELVPPNGSGDTTFNYIQVLMFFLLAIAITVLWSAVDHRRTKYVWTRDLLRSYLRYVLAYWMLSYGLAKVAWDFNQFPIISDAQLNKTWGDSSPMSVVWSFMGSSRAYTIFAGMGEVIGGLLLLFRRTTLLGSLVVLGVMSNVMMLNYCYDIPVKLFSTHLVVMAIYLLLPDAHRLVNLLVFNKQVPAADLRPPYTNSKTIWGQRALKLGLIIFGFAITLGMHSYRQMDYLVQLSKQPRWLQSYDVAKFEFSDDSSAEEAQAWKSLRLEKRAWDASGNQVPTYWLTVNFDEGSAITTFEFAEDQDQLKFSEQSNANLPRGVARLKPLEDDQLLLTGKTQAGDFEAVLEPTGQGRYRLTQRGFRWINEVPFNR